MQTYLPYESFKQCAEVLDRKRLGKQRVEGYQILRTLGNTDVNKRSWNNHPAVRMWKGYEVALACYTIEICNQWKKLGFEDTVGDKVRKMLSLDIPEQNRLMDDEVPAWLGYKLLHVSHQSNLLRKDFEHYESLFPDIQNDLPYLWTYDWPIVQVGQKMLNTYYNVLEDEPPKIFSQYI